MTKSYPFTAFAASRIRRPLIVIDVGYSERRRSCGMHWGGAAGPRQLRFGEAVEHAAKLCGDLDRPILVLEAALSTRHGPDRNPRIRGDFERGRGWYWGPGAVSLLAARRFLSELASELRPTESIPIAEAFLSNKPGPSRHDVDAVEIHDRFWDTQPEPLPTGLEPLCDLVRGVPSVRVFSAPS